MKHAWIRGLFAIAGVYDLVIGVVFLFFGVALFDWAKITHPNHWGYIQFGALMVSIFGIMFFAVAANPVANRNLIPFGILLKLAYAGIVAYYVATTGAPDLFKPFAVIDAVMLVLFTVAWVQLRGVTGPGTRPT